MVLAFFNKEKKVEFKFRKDTKQNVLVLMHCNVIIGRNPIEANSNTGAIQLLGNSVAYIRNCFTLYQEFL